MEQFVCLNILTVSCVSRRMFRNNFQRCQSLRKETNKQANKQRNKLALHYVTRLHYTTLIYQLIQHFPKSHEWLWTLSNSDMHAWMITYVCKCTCMQFYPMLARVIMTKPYGITACTHAYVNIYVHADVPTNVQAYIHAYIDAWMQTYVYTYNAHRNVSTCMLAYNSMQHHAAQHNPVQYNTVQYNQYNKYNTHNTIQKIQ